MDSHQWTLVSLLLSFLVFAIAESAAQLLNKHKLQVILDSKRDKSALGKLLLPPTVGSLRSNLQFGKLLFLIGAVLCFALQSKLTLLNVSIAGAVTIILAIYSPILVTFKSPRAVISALLPVVKFLNFIVKPLDFPRNTLFSHVRAHARKVSNGSEDHDEQQLEAYLGEAEEEGLFEPDEAEMVRQVVEFGDTVVKEVMTPRVSIACVPTSFSLEEFPGLPLS